MRIDVMPISELSEEMKRRWLEIQISNPNLAGPCFHPDLFFTVGKFCPDVHIALIYDKIELTGFFPFLKDQKLSIAQPIDFCDYQAIIGPLSHHWDMNKILKEARLRSWNFNSLVDFADIKSRNSRLERGRSMRVDLSGGCEKYFFTKNQEKVNFSSLAGKKRQIEANFGALRFVPTCNDPQVLHSLLSWKTLQHNRDEAWTKLATGLLENFCFSNQRSLDGILSALYAGNDLLAAFFGIRYQGILHGLICGFNLDFQKFSPGMILWHDIISQHKQLRYHILDFGPGEERYKHDFSNSSLPVIQGIFTEDTIKERIKSVKWLHQGLSPIVQFSRKMMVKI